MKDNSNAQSLVALGFTSLEAEIYGFLLRESAVTGYRIAKALRKAAPNVYKAIESLEQKGAVMVDEGESRVCRAVPPAELLAGLERRFQDDRRRAARALRRIGGAAHDDRVYQLRSPAQVLERCRSMLGRARDIVLVDAFPLPLETLRPDLEQAAARGVRVAAKAYAELAVDGALVTLHPRGQATLDRWPGSWINLVIDGSEHLVALLSSDMETVHQAIWSSSPYLSWTYHSGVSSEIIMTAVTQSLDGGATIQDLRRLMDDLQPVKAIDAAGYQALVHQLQPSGPHPARPSETTSTVSKSPQTGAARTRRPRRANR